MAIFIFSRLLEATWFAQVSSKWIKYRPRSSDFSSLSHGYGDPKLGECDIMENNWRGEEVTDEDLSSIGAINTNGEMVIAIDEIKKMDSTNQRNGSQIPPTKNQPRIE